MWGTLGAAPRASDDRPFGLACDSERFPGHRNPSAKSRTVPGKPGRGGAPAAGGRQTVFPLVAGLAPSDECRRVQALCGASVHGARRAYDTGVATPCAPRPAPPFPPELCSAVTSPGGGGGRSVSARRRAVLSVGRGATREAGAAHVVIPFPRQQTARSLPSPYGRGSAGEEERISWTRVTSEDGGTPGLKPCTSLPPWPRPLNSNMRCGSAANFSTRPDAPNICVLDKNSNIAWFTW